MISKKRNFSFLKVNKLKSKVQNSKFEKTLLSSFWDAFTIELNLQVSILKNHPNSAYQVRNIL